MNKRILIISSELLNPDKILNSTFELSQAEILQEKFDVAILSVCLHTPAREDFIALVKRVLTLRRLSVSYALSKNIFTSIINNIAGKKNFTRKWIIEGIKVYEGHGHPLRTAPDYNYSLKDWVETGMKAYDDYVKENGKPDLVHAHGRFLAAGVLAMQLKKEHHLPYVYTEHSSRFPSGYVPSSSIPVLNKVIDQCSLYIAVSLPLQKKVEETLNRKINNAVVIPNVVDIIFAKPLALPIAKTPFIYSVVANLEHRKGIDILLRAFKKAFSGDLKYQLIIAGEGPEREDLVSLCNYLGLRECVKFKGKISKAEVLELLDRTHVFVLPSRFETFGVAIIEALTRGCPSVSTNCGGPESILPLNCGIVVEPENDDELKEALMKIHRNYQLYNREKIRGYALDRFGPASFLHTMETAYCKELNPPSTKTDGPKEMDPFVYQTLI